MDTTRYPFEVIDEALDRFCNSEHAKDNAMFLRAVRKLRGVIIVYAVVDFGQAAPDHAHALAWAWEDAEIAFKGYGEGTLTGPIVQMWDALSPESWRAFKQTLDRAFDRANALTNEDVKRRYFKGYRAKRVRTPKTGFNEKVVLPTWGPTFRDWCTDNKRDADEEEQLFHYVELYDRKGVPPDEPPPETFLRRGHLTLITGTGGGE